jgi:hypothetical protein
MAKLVLKATALPTTQASLLEAAPCGFLVRRLVTKQLAMGRRAEPPTWRAHCDLPTIVGLWRAEW